MKAIESKSNLTSFEIELQSSLSIQEFEKRLELKIYCCACSGNGDPDCQSCGST
jgi:hypothetical protein